MNELTAIFREKETWGFVAKLIFCAVFYSGIEKQLGIGMGLTPVVVLGSLAVYWKFVRHRFIR